MAKGSPAASFQLIVVRFRKGSVSGTSRLNFSVQMGSALRRSAVSM